MVLETVKSPQITVANLDIESPRDPKRKFDPKRDILAEDWEDIVDYSKYDLGSSRHTDLGRGYAALKIIAPEKICEIENVIGKGHDPVEGLATLVRNDRISIDINGYSRENIL